ncbi:MAG: helix-turn-helix domain-containing protein [Defluviitaleaceae bacterium]|nr:helix-turn-helix domain-containing protein [Defluviitaleaceae bacterium]
MYLGENLKALRQARGFTQEEVGERLNVSPQTISKWERNDTLPDISMLPSLSNFFGVSTDKLIGMDRVNNDCAQKKIYDKGQNALWHGNAQEAIAVYEEALRIYPNNADFMVALALTLALDTNSDRVSDAIRLCERVLAESSNNRAAHTSRAALCFIHLKLGQREKAAQLAENLPSIHESREYILAKSEKNLCKKELDEELKYLALGDFGDPVLISLSSDMAKKCVDHGLLELLKKTREKYGEKLPPMRLRDNIMLGEGQVRVRHYSEFLLDEKFTEPAKACNAIIATLQKMQYKNG